MRKICIGLIGVLFSSCAFGATVTYTLSLNEDSAGECAPHFFQIFASVSQGDNLGLHSFGADLKTPAQSGATLMSYINRSPAGTWDVNPNDPNYNSDPNVVYPTRYAGFGSVRGANISTGVVSGAYYAPGGSDTIKVYGFGQQTGNMNDYYPPPAQVAPDFRPVAYMPYAPFTNTSAAYGTTRIDLPQGSLWLASGTWVGPIAPSFDTSSVDNKSIVWTGPSLGDFSTVFPQFRTVDYCASVPEPGGVMVIMLVSAALWRRRRG